MDLKEAGVAHKQQRTTSRCSAVYKMRIKVDSRSRLASKCSARVQTLLWSAHNVKIIIRKGKLAALNRNREKSDSPGIETVESVQLPPGWSKCVEHAFFLATGTLLTFDFSSGFLLRATRRQFANSSCSRPVVDAIHYAKTKTSRHVAKTLFLKLADSAHSSYMRLIYFAVPVSDCMAKLGKSYDSRKQESFLITQGLSIWFRNEFQEKLNGNASERKSGKSRKTWMWKRAIIFALQLQPLK